MGKFVSFPIRLLLWMYETPIIRNIIIGSVIITTLGLIFPAAIHIYPIWKSSPRDSTTSPFPLEGLSIQTKITHPARLLPGRNYRLRVEVSNNVEFTQPQNVRMELWEEDANIYFTDTTTTPLVIQHTFPAGNTITFTDVVEFRLDEIEEAYDHTTFLISSTSTADPTLITGFEIPIDFFSVPVIALLVVVLPFIGFLLKRLI